MEMAVNNNNADEWRWLLIDSFTFAAKQFEDEDDDEEEEDDDDDDDRPLDLSLA